MNTNRVNQIPSNFSQTPDTILGTHAKALSQSTAKFSSSISQLKSNAQATEDISTVLKEILKEMQDSTQDLINNLSEFKRECLTH